MAKATTLVLRIVEEFKNRGYNIEECHAKEWGTDKDVIYAYEIRNPETFRYIKIEETYRSNGTSENVTATIRINELVYKTVGCWWGIAKNIATIKVPKDASDKVISNRITKAIEAFES